MPCKTLQALAEIQKFSTAILREQVALDVRAPVEYSFVPLFLKLYKSFERVRRVRFVSIALDNRTPLRVRVFISVFLKIEHEFSRTYDSQAAYDQRNGIPRGFPWLCLRNGLCGGPGHSSSLKVPLKFRALVLASSHYISHESL